MSAEDQASATEDLLFEDDEVRVWRLVLPAGTHSTRPDDRAADHWLCVLQGGRALVSGQVGSSAWEIRYTRGQSAFIRVDGTEPKTIANRGDEQMRMLRIELKSGD